MNSLYLQHHGILGQKWGVRRWQYDDGSWTPEGRIRYGKGGRPRSASMSGKHEKMLKKDRREEKTMPLTKSKQSEDNKSLSSLNLSDEQKTKLTRAALAVSAGALGVGAAYAMVKLSSVNGDTVFKAGSMMQRLTVNADEASIDRFYAAVTEFDKKKYEGLYGRSLLRRTQDESMPEYGKAILLKKLTSSEDISIAGKRSSEKLFKELVSTNPEFRRVYGDTSFKSFNYDGLMGRIAGKDSEAQRTANGLYFNYLKENGYGGMVDLNDADHWYQSSRPVIFFGQDKPTISVSSVKEMTVSEINKKYKTQRNITAAQDALRIISSPGFMASSAGVTAVSSGKAIVSNQLDTPNETSVEREKREDN